MMSQQPNPNADFSSDDERWMREALKEARLAQAEDEIPVGAVVVCKGVIVGRGHNQTERLGDVTAHAEIIAITAAASRLGAKYLNDCTLYVTLEPCVMCAGALAWAQVGRIVFGADDPKRGYQRLTPSPLHPKTGVSQGVMAAEAAELVKLFFKGRR